MRAEGDIEQAVAYAQELLEPSQIHFPDPLDNTLNELIQAWENEQVEKSKKLLSRILELAKEMRYL